MIVYRGAPGRGGMSPLGPLKGWAKYAMGRLNTSCPLCNLPARGGEFCEPCAQDLWLEPAQRGFCRQCLATVHEACEQCEACLKEPPAFDMTIAGMAYGFPGDMLIQDFKELGRLDYGPSLASLVARSVRAHIPPSDWPDLLVPVPASRSALKRRGFNPAGELASQLSRQLGIPFRPGGLVCKFDHAPQKTLDLHQRRALVRGRYACNMGLSSLRIGLVDDVMTTGSTLREISHVLIRQGAASIFVLVAARTPMAPPDLAKSRYV